MVRWPHLPRGPLPVALDKASSPSRNPLRPAVCKSAAAMATAVIALGGYLAAVVLFLYWWARLPC